MRSSSRFIVMVVALIALFSTLARGDGLIIIHDPPLPRPGHFTFAPLEVTYHRVTVRIDDLVAVTRVEQEFYNPNPRQLEGTYLFPIPAGAHIDKFEMDINGRMQAAELLDADKARRYYEDIVRRARDPALLEYVGQGAFRARIFPIEPHSRKRVNISYTQLLRSDGGLVDYVYPLNTEKFSAAPLKDVSIKVELSCRQPIKSVYSPSHTVDIRRDGERRAVIGYEDRNVRPDIDFKLIFQPSDDAVGIDLMNWRDIGEGYFLLLASPGVDVPPGRVQKKDVCFVLDTSGSMAERNKLEQAKRALRFCLANLNDGDGFQIIRFSTEAEPLFDGLKDASPDNLDRARKFIEDLKPIGGTAIHEALTRAIDLGRSRRDRDARPYMVIFLTDGLPTIGTTDPQQIVDAVTRGGDAATRIFSFGVGHDVNTHLLDKIADATRATSTYVLPEEDLEIKLSRFFERIAQPVLTGVALSVEGPVRISQVYPNRLPDLFKGEQLVVFGRYAGSGDAQVVISGTLDGQPVRFARPVRFDDRATQHAFIPRLWATRRVGWLLDEIRLRGESAELKDEVVRLAREHGIVTPYTSYLILEDEARRHVPLALQTLRELRDDTRVAQAAGDVYAANELESRDQAAQTGPQAIANARVLGRLRNNDSLDALSERAEGQGLLAKADAPAAEPPGYRTATNYAQQARVVNGRAFYQNGNTWTDARAQELLVRNGALRTQQVAFNSDAYFDLLRRYPHAAAWLSLGHDIDIVLDETLYQIRS